MINKKLAMFYFLLFGYLFGAQLFYAWPFTIDDAFITMRYANHLANGHGLVWNIGQGPVEGYSNFIYVVIESLFIKLNLPLVGSIKVLSLISLLGSCTGLYLISRLWLPTALALLPSLILLMNPGEILWGISGLETPFFQCLIIFTAYALLTNKTAWAGALLAIAGLTRPEAPMLFVVYLGFLLWQYKQMPASDKALAQKGLMAFCLSFIVIYLPYFIWRISYFGRLFPNPVYCKALNAPSGPFILDISYLFLVGPLLLNSLPFLIYQKQFERRFWILILPSIAYMIALINADWIVGYFDRHFLAAYALMLPLIVIGLRALFQLKQLDLPKSWQFYCLIGYSLVAGFLFTSNRYLLKQYDITAYSAASGNQLRSEVSNWLETNIPKNQQVSLGDCGLIPFAYDGHIIDSYCLNSKAFTQPPINYSYARFANWVLNEKKSEVIILLALLDGEREIYPPADKIFLETPQFNEQYRLSQKAVLIQPFGNRHPYGYKYEVYKRVT